MTDPKLATTTYEGRSYEHPVSGISYPSVTTVLNVIGKGDALKQWAANVVADYAVKNKKTWLELDDEAAIDLLKREPLRSLDRASKRGTSVHAVAEAYAKTGSLPTWADGIDGYVQGLKKFFDEHQPEPVFAEATVFNEGIGYAGSFDMICKLDVFPDELVMLDYKTSKAVYPDSAAQLAAYAFAPEYVDDNNKMHAMPKCTRAVIVRCGSDGTYEVKEANLNAGWEYFKAVRAIHKLPTKELLINGKVKAIAIPPERAGELSTWLRVRVLNIKENFPDALQQLVTSWSPMIPTFKSEHVHTAGELALIERMLNTIEGDHSIPFVAGNPRAKPPVKVAKEKAPVAVAPVATAAKKPPVKPPVKVLNNQPVNKFPAKKTDAKPSDEVTVHASEVDKIRQRLSKANKKVQAAAAQLAKEANASKFPISLSGKPSLRRALLVSMILDALVLGDGSPDLLQAVIVHLDLGGFSESLGADVGRLTIDEISKVSSVLSEIKKNTMAVTYDKTTNQFKVQKVRK